VLFFRKKNAVTAEQPAPAMSGERPYGAYEVLGGLQWYRDFSRRQSKAVIVLAVLLSCSMGFNAYLVLTPVMPRYFASTPDGQITELVPLDKPLLSQAGLLNWVSETVTATLSLDFLHWRDKLTQVRSNYTSAAFQSLIASLKESGVIDLIENKRLSVNAVVTQAPVITASGPGEGGVMTWKIEVPLLTSYESSKGVESTQKLLAMVIARREITTIAPRGIAIQQIVLKRDAR
jgi:intracellular multiplication protein IcmL